MKELPYKARYNNFNRRIVPVVELIETSSSWSTVWGSWFNTHDSEQPYQNICSWKYEKVDISYPHITDYSI